MKINQRKNTVLYKVRSKQQIYANTIVDGIMLETVYNFI